MSADNFSKCYYYLFMTEYKLEIMRNCFLSKQEPGRCDVDINVIQPWKIGTEFLTVNRSCISANFIIHRRSQHVLRAEEELCQGYFR
jgi:hypothetical protein